MTKNRQIGKNSPKWLKVLKLGSKWFQGVPRVSQTTQRTYARAPYAFAALGQGPKGPELVFQYKKAVYLLKRKQFCTKVEIIIFWKSSCNSFSFSHFAFFAIRKWFICSKGSSFVQRLKSQQPKCT